MRARDKRHLVSLMVVLMLVLVLAACQATTPTPRVETGATTAGLVKNADGYSDIVSTQLAEMLANKDFVLVNTHIPYEGELPQTDLFIPYNEIRLYVEQLPADKDAPIVLYCRSGAMSTQAAKELVQLGYTHVMELDGGFNAWKLAGYEFLFRE